MIGLGKEATWGTAVPSTAFFTARESVGEERGRLREDMTFGTRAKQAADGGRLRIRGGINDIHARPANIGHLLQAALGAPTTSGAGPYSHVFAPGVANAGALNACVPYSATIKRGSTVHRYSGGQLSRLELRNAKDGPLMVNTDWIFKGVADVAAETQALEDASRFLYRHLQVTKGGSAFAYVEDLALTWDNALETEEVFNETDEISAVDFGGIAGFDVQMTITFRDSTTYDDFVANTTAAWGFRWEIDADTFLDIQIPKLNIERWSAPISGPGRMTITVGATAEYSVADGHDVEITLSNDQATY